MDFRPLTWYIEDGVAHGRDVDDNMVSIALGRSFYFESELPEEELIAMFGIGSMTACKFDKSLFLVRDATILPEPFFEVEDGFSALFSYMKIRPYDTFHSTTFVPKLQKDVEGRVMFIDFQDGEESNVCVREGRDEPTMTEKRSILKLIEDQKPHYICYIGAESVDFAKDIVGVEIFSFEKVMKRLYYHLADTNIDYLVNRFIPKIYSEERVIKMSELWYHLELEPSIRGMASTMYTRMEDLCNKPISLLIRNFAISVDPRFMIETHTLESAVLDIADVGFFRDVYVYDVSVFMLEAMRNSDSSSTREFAKLLDRCPPYIIQSFYNSQYCSRDFELDVPPHILRNETLVFSEEHVGKIMDFYEGVYIFSPTSYVMYINKYFHWINDYTFLFPIARKLAEIMILARIKRESVPKPEKLVPYKFAIHDVAVVYEFQEGSKSKLARVFESMVTERKIKYVHVEDRGPIPVSCITPADSLNHDYYRVKITSLLKSLDL
jgi:hypothetical protein